MNEVFIMSSDTSSRKKRGKIKISVDVRLLRSSRDFLLFSHTRCSRINNGLNMERRLGVPRRLPDISLSFSPGESDGHFFFHRRVTHRRIPPSSDGNRLEPMLS